jgi:hypothetical protein
VASPRHVATVGSARLLAASCPSVSLCVVANQQGYALTTDDPTAPSPVWTTAEQISPDEIESVSCPSTSLCVATGGSATADKGDGEVTQDPTAASPSWSAATVIDPDGTSVGDGDVGVSCASISLCVAVDGMGYAVTSHNPAANTWGTPVEVTPITSDYLNAISCPSTSLCVAVGDVPAGGSPGGYAWITDDPTVASPTWTESGSISPGQQLSAVSCPSTSLCVATNYNGEAVITTNPAAATPTWTQGAPIGSEYGVSCASTSLCVTVGGNGNTELTTDPTAAPPTWAYTDTNGANSNWGASCAPGTMLCIVVGDNGTNGTVVVGLSAPTNNSLPSISGTDTAGQTLTETNGSWAEGPTSFLYQWQDCDSSGNNCSAISGATSQTYKLAGTDVGHTVRVEESATNGAGTAGPVSSAQTAAVSAAPPLAPPVGTPTVGNPTVSGTTVHDVVSCTGGSGATCAVTFSLAVTETLKSGKVIAVTAKAKRKPKTTKRVVVIGTATVTLDAGQTQSVAVKLNSVGQSLLKSRHALVAKLTAVSGTSVLATPTVTLKEPKLKKKKKR